MLFSSRNLHWRAIDLERHIICSREVPAGMIDCVLLLMWRGNSIARGEHPDSNGSTIIYAKRPDTLTLFAPGELPLVRTTTRSDFLLCAFSKNLLDKIKEEAWEDRNVFGTDFGKNIATDEPSFHDGSLVRLLMLLEDEVKSSGVSGPLYEEHLAHALATRLFTMINRDVDEASRRVADKLPSKVLRQIIDRIEANPLEQFRLSGLATDCGYSYGRFIREFRAKTGSSPHRYITRLRLDLAKQLMCKRSLSLLEIALNTGFASHAHFTHAFRQHFGCAPSHFRTSLKK